MSEGDTLPEVFRILLDSRDPQVLKPPFLKSLYYLLVQLSSDFDLRHSDSTITSARSGISIKFSDVISISDFLFDKVSKGFELLFSNLGVVPVNVAFQQNYKQSSVLELTLLLRSSMLLLLLLDFDNQILAGKCQILLMILKKLCSPKMLSISNRGNYNGKTTRSVNDSSTYSVHKSTSPTTCICSILEVFMDELLLHRQLRVYFKRYDCLPCTNEKLFVSHLIFEDSDAILEIVAAHFLLSVFHERSFEKFVTKLFLRHREETLSYELSLPAAMHFIGNSVLFSAPPVFQVYAISSVSRYFRFNKAPGELDPHLTSWYFSVFERSVILYAGHLSRLLLDRGSSPCNNIAESRSASRKKRHKSQRGFRSSFEYCVRKVTYENIGRQVAKFSDLWHHSVAKTKSELMDASVVFTKKNEYVFDDCHREEAVQFLHCIISKTLYDEHRSTLLENSGKVNREDVILLSSVIDLMSSSLLRIVLSGHQKKVNENSCFKEYKFIIGSISCFQLFSSSSPIMKLLSDSANHKELKFMLMHFVDLLSYILAEGHEYLRNSCIFMIMILMTLLIFEEGGLDGLKSLFSFQTSLALQISVQVPEVVCIDSQLASKFSSLPVSDYVKVMRKSSFTIASRFQNIQKAYLSNDVCNGKKYVQLFKKGLKNSSSYDDLADFVECKQEKDYSVWLKDRTRLRFILLTRRLDLKKKKACKYIKGSPQTIKKKLILKYK